MDSDVLERQELTGGGGARKDNAVDATIAVAPAAAGDGIDGYISQLDKDGNIEQARDRLSKSRSMEVLSARTHFIWYDRAAHI